MGNQSIWDLTVKVHLLEGARLLQYSDSLYFFFSFNEVVACSTIRFLFVLMSYIKVKSTNVFSVCSI